VFEDGTYEFVGPVNATLFVGYDLTVTSQGGSASTFLNLNGYQFLEIENATVSVSGSPRKLRFVKLTGITFSNGSAESGAVFHVQSSVLVLDDTVFLYNTANHSGGAIYAESDYNYTSSLEISNSQFSHNHAQDEGGSITLVGVPLTLTNVNFDNNETPGQGGAIYCLGGAATGTNIVAGMNRSSLHSKSTKEKNYGGNSGGFFHANNFCDNTWNAVSFR
jgi:predicted outer membrane repeat protein